MSGDKNEDSVHRQICQTSQHMTQAVIILGMHRSGTSCLTGCLEMAGLEVGNVDRKRHSNPKGNRENRAIMDLNNAVLADHDATWDNPPDRDIVWSTAQTAERDRLIGSYPQDRAWGFKEPRTLLVFNGWREALPDALLVASFRHPLCVAQSLQSRNGFPIEKGLSLWLHYNRILLELCESEEVSLISFDCDVSGYAAQLARILNRIGFQASPDVTSFFEPGLRRNLPPQSCALPGDIEATYSRLNAHAT